MENQLGDAKLALKSLQTNGTAVPDIETRLEAEIQQFWNGQRTGEMYDLCVDALTEIRRLRAALDAARLLD